MANEIEIKADYQHLEQLASKFMQQHGAVQQTLQHVKASMDKLHEGWVGKGSRKFFSEMQGEVLPASKRLEDALQEASQVTKKIIEIMRQAENEGSALFHR